MKGRPWSLDGKKFKMPTTVEEVDALLAPCYCGLPWSHPDHDHAGPSVIGPISVRLQYEGIGRDLQVDDDERNRTP